MNPLKTLVFLAVLCSFASVGFAADCSLAADYTQTADDSSCDNLYTNGYTWDTDGHDLTVAGDVEVNTDGLIQGRTGDHTFGSLTINSDGTYSATSGTTTITSESADGYAVYNYAGGTFTANNGLILIESGVYTHTRNSGTGKFYNIQISNDTEATYVTAMVIDNDLTIDAGSQYHSSNSPGNYALTVTGDVSVSGLLSGQDNGAMSFGSLTINSDGTYSATSGTTTITSETAAGYAMEWISGATYTHNSGTLTFTYAGATIARMVGYSTNPLYNVILNDANLILFWGNGANIDGNFTVTNGILNTNGYITFIEENIIISAGMVTSNNNELFLTGDLTIASGATANTQNPNGRWTITGDVGVSGTFDCDANSATMTLGSLTINSGGTYSATSGTTMVKGNWNSTNGIFTHNSGTVNFTDFSSNSVLDGGPAFYSVGFDTDGYSMILYSFDALDMTLTGGTIENHGSIGSENMRLTVTGGLFVLDDGSGIGRSTFISTYNQTGGTVNGVTSYRGRIYYAGDISQSGGSLVETGGTTRWFDAKDLGNINMDISSDASGLQLWVRYDTKITAQSDIAGLANIILVPDLGKTSEFDLNGKSFEKGDINVGYNTDGTTNFYTPDGSSVTLGSYDALRIGYAGSSPTATFGTPNSDYTLTINSNLDRPLEMNSPNGVLNLPNSQGYARMNGANTALQLYNGTINGYGGNLSVAGSVYVYDDGVLDMTGGGKASFGSLTINAGGTYSATPERTTLYGDLDIDGTFTHNDGTIVLNRTNQNIAVRANGASFYTIEVPQTSQRAQFYENLTIENMLNTIETAHPTALYDDVYLTMGTDTSSGTVQGQIYFSLSNDAFNAYLYAANQLYPVIMTADPYTYKGNAHLKWVDIQADVTTKGYGVTMVLDGDCEFDAFSVSTTDTLDLNGHRAEFSGILENEIGGGSINATDSMMVAAGFDAEAGTATDIMDARIIITAAGSYDMDLATNPADTIMINSDGIVTQSNGQVTARQRKFIVGSGMYEINGNNFGTTDIQIASDANLSATTDTITVSGNFIAGGLLGESALSLSGSQYVDVPDDVKTPLQDTDEFSIEGWFKSSSQSGYGAIIQIYEDWYVGTLGFYNLGQLKAAYVYDSSVNKNVELSDTSLYIDGKWHHTIVTSSKTEGLKLYLDGKLVDSESFTYTDVKFYSDNTAIGRTNSGSHTSPTWGYFNGELDQIRVWNKVLSESEIRSLMFKSYDEMTASEKNGLVSKWEFDEGSSTTVSDSHGGNHGTASDPDVWVSDGPGWLAGSSKVVFDGGIPTIAPSLTFYDVDAKNGVQVNLFDTTISGALSAADTSVIYRQWYVTIAVTDKDGNAVEDASVSLVDDDDATVYLGDTGQSGTVTLNTSEYIRTLSGKDTKTPHNLTASKGLERNSILLTINRSRSTGIILDGTNTGYGVVGIPVTEGFSDFKVMIGETEGRGPASGVQTVKLMDGSITIAEFQHDFDSDNLDIGDWAIRRGENWTGISDNALPVTLHVPIIGTYCNVLQCGGIVDPTTETCVGGWQSVDSTLAGVTCKVDVTGTVIQDDDDAMGTGSVISAPGFDGGMVLIIFILAAFVLVLKRK